MSEPLSVDIREANATLTLDEGKANALALGWSLSIDAALDPVLPGHGGEMARQRVAHCLEDARGQAS